MKTVKTVSCDTWDIIAHREYGDTAHAQTLMEARENVRLLDFEVFPAGIVVAVPEVLEDISEYDLPPWRK